MTLLSTSFALTPLWRPASSAGIGLCLVLVGCGAEESPTPTQTPAAGPTPTATATATPTEDPSRDCPAVAGCDAVVCPSDDDQTAVQAALIGAQVGQTICLSAGTFTFYTELELALDGVTLKGAGRDETLLDFSGQVAGGNGIAITGNGCTVEGLRVQDTPGDGVRSTDVEGITYREVSVIWTADESPEAGAYGLYPVGSSHVHIEGCEVKGARDAGIYVGQSHHILVVDNEARGNVAGIEIENSSDAEVVGNWAHDNTGGILVFNLPDLPVKDGKRTKVHQNVVESNNTANFAPPGNIVGVVPKGTGLLLLSTDDNEIHDNIIRDNQSAGIAVFSYSEALVGESYDDPEFDPYPERNFIHDNILENNGYDPQDVAADLLSLVNAVAEEAVEPPLPSLLWDGCVNEEAELDAVKNCFNANASGEDESGNPTGEATYGNFKMCDRPPFRNYTTDISGVTCVYDTLPSQSW